MTTITSKDRTARYSELANTLVSAANGIDYAYRDTGPGDGVPLVLLQHFRGNLDNWDPALIDALAADRRVVTFDYAGVGGSAGETAHTVEQMAQESIVFIEALDLRPVDLLGFSIGSFVAQQIALTRPAIVRRVVLASAAPQGAAGMHGWAAAVIGAIGAPQTSPEEYLDVFFARSPASREAGQQAPCNACTQEPRTGTRRRPGRRAKRSMTRSAPGGSPITRCCSGSAACRCRCSWPTATATR